MKKSALLKLLEMEKKEACSEDIADLIQDQINNIKNSNQEEFSDQEYIVIQRTWLDYDHSPAYGMRKQRDYDNIVANNLEKFHNGYDFYEGTPRDIWN